MAADPIPTPAGTSPRTYLAGRPTPGVNTDLVDPDACAAEAAKIGYDTPELRMVAHYAGMRWQRGEEAQAINMLLSYGINLTSAYRIIAAGRAAASGTDGDDSRPDDGPVVLVVDDDADMRDIVADILTGDGLQVVQASSVNDGLQVAADRPITVVIHDVDLRDGGRLTDDVIARYAALDIPVLAFTGLPSTAPAAARRVLSKADLPDLSAAVADLVGGQPA